MREFLEKNYTDEAIETDDLTIKLVIKALLEVSLDVSEFLHEFDTFNSSRIG